MKNELMRLRAIIKAQLEQMMRDVDRAEKAEAEVERLRADAERYRWLRQYIRNADETKFIFDPSAAHCDEDQFDAFIDNARAGEA
jgi:hypothetical protein